MTSHAAPAETDYIVLRPTEDLKHGVMPRSCDGEWRKRSDLATQDYVELLGPTGNVRAYPTHRTETDAAGDLAQV